MSTATFNKRLADLHGFVAKAGAVSGLGYTVIHTQGGAGFSYLQYSQKDLPNGARVHLDEHFPSPFAKLAGINDGITSRYTVWLGQTDDGENGPCPFPIPVGAKPDAWAPDAEVNWYADFGEDGEAAEKYALSLPNGS